MVTWNVVVARTVFPSLSVTLAVMVWVPPLSARLNVGPVPMGPSRLDVHWRADERSPSGMSNAVPLNVIG